jgi:LemA protein
LKAVYSGIDALVKRRCMLVPQLVQAAKGYLQHEREALQDVIVLNDQARAASQAVAADPSMPEAVIELNNTETALKASLRHLLAVVEYYPGLKASVRMNRLVEELNSTEYRIVAANKSFNSVVSDYNTTRDKMPNWFVSRPMRFKRAVMLKVPASREQAAPSPDPAPSNG